MSFSDMNTVSNVLQNNFACLDHKQANLFCSEINKNKYEVCPICKGIAPEFCCKVLFLHRSTLLTIR